MGVASRCRLLEYIPSPAGSSELTTRNDGITLYRTIKYLSFDLFYLCFTLSHRFAMDLAVAARILAADPHSLYCICSFRVFPTPYSLHRM